MSESEATLCGNIIKDPELRFTASGNASVTIGLAVNRRWQDKTTNEWVEKVSFFNVVVWGPMAERVAECFQKGHRIVATGRLSQRSWETENGDKRSVIELEAYDIGASVKFDPVEVHKADRVKKDTREAPVYAEGEEPF